MYFLTIITERSYNLESGFLQVGLDLIELVCEPKDFTLKNNNRQNIIQL